MISILESFTKWVAAATVAALFVAIAHEYGYFSVVGTHFQTVATTFDYLVNALVWLPSTFVMVAVIYGFDGWMTEPTPDEVPALPWFLVAIMAVLIGAVSTATFFYGGSFAYGVAYMISVMIVYAGLCAYAFRYSHVPWETYRILLFIPIIFTFSFAYGTMLAYGDLQKTSDVYFLKYKTDSVVRPVVMLRGFERGLLVRDYAKDRVELVRWDELTSFSRFATSNREPSLACRWLNVSCERPLEPPS